MEKSRSLCIITNRDRKYLKTQILDWFTSALGITFNFIQLVYANSDICNSSDIITVEIYKKVIIKYQGVEVLWFESLNEMLEKPTEVLIVLSIIAGQLCILVDTFDDLPDSDFWDSSIAQELTLCFINCVEISNKFIKVYHLRKLEISNSEYKFINITPDLLENYLTIPIVYNSIQNLRNCGICCDTVLIFDSICEENHYYCTACCSRLDFCPVCRKKKPIKLSEI